MLQFKIKADEVTASALGLTEDAIVEGYCKDGEIVIRILDNEEEAGDISADRRACPYFYKDRGACVEGSIKNRRRV